MIKCGAKVNDNSKNSIRKKKEKERKKNCTNYTIRNCKYFIFHVTRMIVNVTRSSL